MSRIKTYCKHGHKLTPQNVYIRPDTRRRQCRPCKRQRDAVYQSSLRRSVHNRWKTHCKRGHEFNEANTYVYRGGRNCRACRKLPRPLPPDPPRPVKVKPPRMKLEPHPAKPKPLPLKARLKVDRETPRKQLAKLPKVPTCWAWPFPDRAQTADDLFLWHAGRCAICNKIANTVIDHDHATGLIRGLLCISCNVLEARHDGVFAHYRSINPASILDIQARFFPVRKNDPYRPWRQA